MTKKNMKIRGVIIPFLMLVLLTGLATGIAAQAAQTYTATPSSDKTMLNGSPVTMQAYKISNNNYVKLRDFAQMVNGTPLNFEVTWDGSLNAINMYTRKPYTPVGGEGAAIGTEEKQAADTTSAIYVNGQVVSLKGYNINNNNYFKLRDLGVALGIGIDWDNNTRTVIVDSTGSGSTVETGMDETENTENTSTTTSTRVISNKIGENGYPDGPKMLIEERIALAQATTLPPTDVNHPGWGPKGGFFLATLKPGEEAPDARSYAYVGIEHTGEAGGASWSGVSVGG